LRDELFELAGMLQWAASMWAFLLFCHFCADWLGQSNEEAEAKKDNVRVRAVHCLKYALYMAFPVWVVVAGDWLVWGSSLLLLYSSHYIGDSYRLTLWWARRVRHIPEEQMVPGWPMTVILVVVVDQLWHLAWLWVPAIASAVLAAPKG